MIYPTPADILRCVAHTIQMASADDMPRMAVKSALATSGHLIRHVELRMKMERSIDRMNSLPTKVGGVNACALGKAAVNGVLPRNIK